MKQFLLTVPTVLLCGIWLLVCLPACKKQPTLDTVLKDLPAESYALHFEELPPNDKVITQAGYGKLPEGLMYDIDEICPPLKVIGYGKIPPIMIPPRIFIPPTQVGPKLFPPRTCPDFVPWRIQESVLELIRQSNWKYAKEIESVKAGEHGVLISSSVLKDFRAIQPDRMDTEGMKGVDINQVFVAIPESLGAAAALPDGAKGGGPDFFKRAWYGQRWKGIKLPPRYIGCFDPVYLSIIRENLIRYDKQRFESLQVNELDAAAKTASLSF